MHLHDALALFVAQLQADGRSPHTVGQYRRAINGLAAWAAREGLSGEIEDLDHVALARFLGAPEAMLTARGKPKGPVSMNALRSGLRVFFGYLCDADYLPKNPARLIKRARCGERPPRGLSEAELAAFFMALDDGEGPAAKRDQVLFKLLRDTGLRAGSAVALDVEDFAPGDRLLEVRVAKGQQPQLVEVPEALAGRLETFVEGREGAIFVGQRGDRLSTRHVGRRFQHWWRAAGLCRRASPHSLRHTFALGLYRQTRDIFAVQRALGHRSIGATAVYADTSAGLAAEGARPASVHSDRS
jgi:integrase/recombinase XerC